jgi:Asp-tRNA(Asn)/Glu-tRNA(Gln) amidotransferase A subunit family amidase
LEIILEEDLSRYDTTMLPGIWNDTIFNEYSSKEKLRFGYYFDDGVTIASPPVERAILQTVKALESQGHEAVPITPPNVIEAVRVFLALTSEEGYFPQQTPLI